MFYTNNEFIQTVYETAKLQLWNVCMNYNYILTNMCACEKFWENCGKFGKIKPGSVVLVPFGREKELGVVWDKPEETKKKFEEMYPKFWIMETKLLN